MAYVHRDEVFSLKYAVAVNPDAPAVERQAARRWLVWSWTRVHP